MYIRSKNITSTIHVHLGYHQENRNITNFKLKAYESEQENKSQLS